MCNILLLCMCKYEAYPKVRQVNNNVPYMYYATISSRFTVFSDKLAIHVINVYCVSVRLKFFGSSKLNSVLPELCVSVFVDLRRSCPQPEIYVYALGSTCK